MQQVFGELLSEFRNKDLRSSKAEYRGKKHAVPEDRREHRHGHSNSTAPEKECRANAREILPSFLREGRLAAAHEQQSRGVRHATAVPAAKSGPQLQPSTFQSPASVVATQATQGLPESGVSAERPIESFQIHAADQQSVQSSIPGLALPPGLSAGEHANAMPGSRQLPGLPPKAAEPLDKPADNIQHGKNLQALRQARWRSSAAAAAADVPGLALDSPKGSARQQQLAEEPSRKRPRIAIEEELSLEDELELYLGNPGTATASTGDHCSSTFAAPLWVSTTLSLHTMLLCMRISEKHTSAYFIPVALCLVQRSRQRQQTTFRWTGRKASGRCHRE